MRDDLSRCLPPRSRRQQSSRVSSESPSARSRDSSPPQYKRLRPRACPTNATPATLVASVYIFRTRVSDIETFRFPSTCAYTQPSLESPRTRKVDMGKLRRKLAGSRSAHPSQGYPTATATSRGKTLLYVYLSL